MSSFKSHFHFVSESPHRLFKKFKEASDLSLSFHLLEFYEYYAFMDHRNWFLSSINEMISDTNDCRLETVLKRKVTLRNSSSSDPNREWCWKCSEVATPAVRHSLWVQPTQILARLSWKLPDYWEILEALEKRQGDVATITPPHSWLLRRDQK